MTITIQIGNSDDKLTQREWADFISTVTQKIGVIWPTQIHFSGGSNINSPYQNYCWVLVIDSNVLGEIEKNLTLIRKHFRQDSVAITIGETKFI